ncbi:MAG: LptF/LptG family permease [Cyclobacteriaceae bacterium]
MRRLDKLILKSFFGPFILTTAVATFILLLQYMLKYFDDFVGKDLGFTVFAELLFYFALNMLQVALPLGVLVSSLMTYGNLGEYFELTAIKSAGISLTRTLKPIFFFVVLLSIGAFYFNDRIVPSANLKAYSLLYDIKHTKPALDIKPGVFYNGIPNYSIKAGAKLRDNQTLKDVIIYDHTRGRGSAGGNRTVILADSSRIYTFYNDKFLKWELFNGVHYDEQPNSERAIDNYQRTYFSRLDMVFSLSSFDLKRTKEELFRNNRQMKNVAELTKDIDSLAAEQIKITKLSVTGSKDYLTRHFKHVVEKAQDLYPSDPKAKGDTTIVTDSAVIRASFLPELNLISFLPQQVNQRKKQMVIESLKDRAIPTRLDSVTMADVNDTFTKARKKAQITRNALSQARNFKQNMIGLKVRLKTLTYEKERYKIEKFKKYSQAFACIVMFLIGAPLGSIIKKGGMGVPVIVSIFFFIIYYVLTITSEKWAKAGMMDGGFAVWIADIVLLPFGLFFLRQARIDARLFDMDAYLVWFDRFKFKSSSNKKT